LVKMAKRYKKRILVACEESQVVTVEFRKLGFAAFSADLQPTSGKHPEWHYQQDVIPLLKKKWDMIIAFPPCTHLAASGARWFAEKRADGRQQAAIEFFMEFVYANSMRICIENPVGIMSTVWKKPDQYIEPWQFGHGEVKKTGLWLKNLPLLIPTKIVSGRVSTVMRMGPQIKERAKLRSKTYPGVAKAMAKQWGPLLG